MQQGHTTDSKLPRVLWKLVTILPDLQLMSFPACICACRHRRPRQCTRDLKEVASALKTWACRTTFRSPIIKASKSACWLEVLRRHGHILLVGVSADWRCHICVQLRRARDVRGEVLSNIAVAMARALHLTSEQFLSSCLPHSLQCVHDGHASVIQLLLPVCRARGHHDHISANSPAASHR